jgi:hypothetical protein
MGPFEYFRKNAEASAVFNAAMTSLSARSGTGMVERYDFSGLRKVVVEVVTGFCSLRF